jgi:peptide/nickel transport system substrate-binding protein
MMRIRDITSSLAITDGQAGGCRASSKQSKPAGLESLATQGDCIASNGQPLAATSLTPACSSHSWNVQEMRSKSARVLLAACFAIRASGAVMAAALPDPTLPIVYYDMAGNETLDPAEPQNNSSYSHETLLAIYETLIRMDDAGVPSPGLAESWTRNADLTEMTLKLRPGVTFHDGTPFNAEAVRKNFERSAALGSRAGGTTVETFKLVSGIEVVADDTIRLKLNKPSGQIEFWLGSNPGMMISPAALKEGVFGGTVNAIGAGAFRLRRFDPNVTTLMDRNETYWGGTKDRPVAFEHHYVPDGRARLNALRSGQANVALIDPRQIPEAKSAGLTVQVVQKNALWDIYPNINKGPLGDPRVRQAIMYAIDREGLADAISNGSAKAARQLWSDHSPYYVKELDDRYPFDQNKARALLAEAGYKDGFELSQLLLNNSEYRQLAEALQANLAEVGIKVKFDVVDVSQFPLFFKQPPRGDILMARYGGRSDPVQTVFELVGTGGPYAPGGAASPKIDEIINKVRAMAASDPARNGLMRDLAREISDQAATLPVISRANVYAYKPGCILNLVPYLPSGDDRFNDVHVAKGCK